MAGSPESGRPPAEIASRRLGRQNWGGTRRSTSAPRGPSVGRHAKYPFKLEDDRTAGGTPKKRGAVFKVRFRDPAEPKYREAATGVT